MQKKIFYWVCGVTMVLCLALGITARFLDPSETNYQITTWTLVMIFAARPLFYGCLGAVSAVKLFPPIENTIWRRVSLIAGIVLTLLLAYIAIAEILGHPVTLVFFQVLRQLFRSSGFFLVPGFLVGLGLFDE